MFYKKTRLKYFDKRMTLIQRHQMICQNLQMESRPEIEIITTWFPTTLSFVKKKSADTEICDEECDSPESVNEQTQEESPREVHTAEDVPIVAEVHAISEEYDLETENNSSESLQDQTDEEPPAKVCKILDRSQALNVLAQQKRPLLRANSNDFCKCELCEFNSKYFSAIK
ncbi:hypothetical protein GH733_003733 [Mirounga leonina]|nr:hypothetical protein GH733_003733 [Mirounga leonina]